MKPAVGRTRISRPAWVVAAVALASAAAMVPAAAHVMRQLGDPCAGAEFADFGPRNRPILAPVFAAAMVAACALLGWAAERTIRRTPASPAAS
jgi:hypothetical protein